MLRGLRLHGPCGRPEGEGDQEGDTERGCGLHHRRQGHPHRGRLSRNYQNGNSLVLQLLFDYHFISY